MSNPKPSAWQELATDRQREELFNLALERRWPLSLMLTGWLHLFAFGLCYYLTIVANYHEAAGYMTIWISELLGMGLIFRLIGGPRLPEQTSQPLERLIIRVWISYFLLAFNLGSMNTLRGHAMFEFFPAMASLGSFAFLVLTFTVHRGFFAAVVVLFASGLLEAAFLWHAFGIFAIAWWLILNGLALRLWYLAGKSLSGHSGQSGQPIPVGPRHCSRADQPV